MAPFARGTKRLRSFRRTAQSGYDRVLVLRRPAKAVGGAPTIAMRRPEAGAGRMTSMNETPGGAGRAGDGLSWVPAAWLLVMVLLAAYGLVSGVTLLATVGDLPRSALVLVYSGFAFGVVTVVWGLFMLTLSFNGSPRFARQFVAWQSLAIAFVGLREAYVLATPDFVFSARALAIAIAEAAVGLFCIHLVRRRPQAGATGPLPGRERPSVGARVAAAVLGLLVGGAAGCGAGLLAGSVIADVAGISCFEGGCGYFALLIGLVGLVVGAVAGTVLGIWLARRNKAAVPAE
jgi:hypothetical protein